MQPVANTKTDAAGHYHFDKPEIGSGPMLLRVTYYGVNYFEPLMPGKTNVDIQVYDSTDKPGSVQVSTHAIIIQPDGDQLKIGEEYTIENHTNPPVAYYKDGGTFEFTIPENAKLGEVSAWSAAGMPVVQQTIDKGKNARRRLVPVQTRRKWRPARLQRSVHGQQSHHSHAFAVQHRTCNRCSASRHANFSDQVSRLVAANRASKSLAAINLLPTCRWIFPCQVSRHRCRPAQRPPRRG